MGQILSPQKKTVSDLKAKILQPSLTSHFQCQFTIPSKVKDLFPDNDINLSESDLSDLFIVSCTDASLPGSSLATHELNNDFTGVTQRHAYRRLYDDRAQFSFYVDKDYMQIRVFEVWMRFINGEELSYGEKTNIAFRSNFPTKYKSSLYLTKFERDLKNYVTYTFVNAFPVQIDSMPVSYDSSQLLKCTVSFSYDRYVLSNPKASSTTDLPPSQITNNTTTAYNPNTNLGLDYGKYTTTGGVSYNQSSSSGNSISVKDAYSGNFNLNV